ncbi:hypothetical protein D8B26_007009 [Coccidioides posadasii str. Silveira]|uniref:uncharacterized protein n=1 Tax=Coccidioides posadasii (strain RMSCC 757 / Silveira) TaxID=443226 RepID=UPI001BEEE9E5|nr:hypothetical protein D8B26_007009 [Coccidioides posadasii str. Silveira]
MENFNIIVTGGHQDEDLINDNLTDILHNLAIFGGPSQGTAAAQNQNKLHLADFHKINPIRARVDGPNFKFPSSPTYNESDFLRYWGSHSWDNFLFASCARLLGRNDKSLCCTVCFLACPIKPHY